jgi:PhzF family phenazine biosynthesis protein
MRFHSVDTFVDAEFAGNPAAVVELAAPAPTAVMQAAAHHIGLPTTAFVTVRGGGEYGVRWFTPYAEINLCGHATIASARLLFTRPENRAVALLTFRSDNGVLHADREGDLIGIDLPAAPVTAADPPAGLLAALRVDAGSGYRSCHVSSDDVLVELVDAAAVAALRPDFPALARQPFRGHIVTAPADGGFVSRTFFPALGVHEDQVCVTAHAKLAPFWARRLGRSRLSARQLSRRGGRLEVRDAGERVRVLGTAVLRPGTGDVPFGAGPLPEALSESR